MSEAPTTQHRRFRFSLRTLLVIVAMAALTPWGVQQLYSWYFSVPLSDAIASFNAQSRDSDVGQLERPLTENEVVSAIRAQLQTIPDQDSRVICNRIIRTKRVPRGSSFHWIPGSGYIPSTGESYTVWWINLNVMTGPSSGFSFCVRKANNPVAAQANGTGYPGP